MSEVEKLLVKWAGESSSDDQSSDYECGEHAARAECREELQAAIAADKQAQPSGEVDWRAMYRFQTAMRYMDSNPTLTKERAYAMADADCAALAHQPQDGRKGEEG